jgi:hypothetical protein
MKRACIAIVDATRARIYAYDYDRAAESQGVSTAVGGTLHQAIDLVNPARRGHDAFSATRPGIKRGAPGTGPTGDRGEHPDDLDRRFARQVVEEIDRISRERALDRVLLVATPAMLGELRGVDGSLQRPELLVEYVARDLARLTSPQIHDHLTQLRLVAPRRASFAPARR